MRVTDARRGVVSFAWSPHGRTIACVGFYAYPADTHFPGSIVHTTDVYRRWVGWRVSHLRQAH